LLIGGNSAAGKTSLAESLARILDVRYVDLDLFWIVLKRSVPTEVAPDLHLFDDDSIWLDLDPDTLVDRYLRVSAWICEAIVPLLVHHSTIRRPVIIEGAWVLPEFARRHNFGGRDLTGPVSSIFVVEPDPEAIEQRIAARPQRWLESLSPSARRNHLEMHRRHGFELRRRAEALGLPVLDAQPFETLAARAIGALDLASARDG
jgi:2-phosphoglycerate kinase